MTNQLISELYWFKNLSYENLWVFFITYVCEIMKVYMILHLSDIQPHFYSNLDLLLLNMFSLSASIKQANLYLSVTCNKMAG